MLKINKPWHRLLPIGRSTIRRTHTKPTYTTTPIFYVNASPHIGHLYSMLIADTVTRWNKLNPKNKAYMLTGTDEHGLKVQATAEKLGIEPKQLVDDVSMNFKKLAELSNVQYDRFIRTTDEDHVRLVKWFWELMMEKGYIYEGSHCGWYCVSDETFYPEAQTKQEGDKRISIETGNEVVMQQEVNYFFKLSAFQQELLEFLLKNPDFIKPKSKYEFIVRELQLTKLGDLSISRPASRLKWSIEVPNDPSQKIYVWFDALLNYLTAAGFPHGFTKAQSEEYITPLENIWPATHIIGKDIIRFHCIYWPIFLMAAKIELPKQVIVHSHWLCEGVKMSKSLGNVVDPIEISEYYGVDPVRFFLMANSNIEDDCKFSEELMFQSRELLVNKYANLMLRIGGKNFDILQAIGYYRDGKFDGIEELLREFGLASSDVEVLIKDTQELITSLNQLYPSMDQKINQFDYMKACKDWWHVIDNANLVFQSAEPWKYAKKLKKEEDNEKYRIIMNYFIYLSAETCRIASIVIQPIMPQLSDKILNRLAVEPDRRSSEWCLLGKDLTYGKDANDTSKHELPIERVEIRK